MQPCSHSTNPVTCEFSISLCPTRATVKKCNSRGAHGPFPKQDNRNLANVASKPHDFLPHLPRWHHGRPPIRSTNRWTLEAISYPACWPACLRHPDSNTPWQHEPRPWIPGTWRRKLSGEPQMSAFQSSYRRPRTSRTSPRCQRRPLLAFTWPKSQDHVMT